MEREPVAYILGRREFWSLEFRVSPAVLIPRPDSETLIEAALGLYPDAGAALRVLDLGTGSGCLLLALLSERPNATGTGFDISAAALDVARSNAAALGLSSRARFAQGDWADLADGLDGAPFDLVLANPPYIPDPECLSLDRDVRDHEPHLALFGGADGLDAYRAILEILNYVLVPRGIALFEIGAGQTEPVSTLAGQAGYAVTGLFRDLAGHPRALAMTGRPEGVDKKMVGMGAPKG
jgi:release factor glutamine methyltransferase